MINAYRRMVGLRCPDCQTPQPVLNLTTTAGGLFPNVRLNPDVGCIQCASRLRLVRKFATLETTVLRIFFGVVHLVLSILRFFGIVGTSLLLFGLWGLLILPVYVVVAVMLSAWFNGRSLSVYLTVCSQ